MKVTENKIVFNEELDGRLISVLGGAWSGYFFVRQVHQCELELMNGRGEEVILGIHEITEGTVKVEVFPKMPIPLHGVPYGEPINNT